MTRRATYRIRVRLNFTEPEIWRLLEAPADLPLPWVHDVLQVGFGWQNSHLHAFTAADGRRWLDAFSLDDGMDGQDEATATLADVLTEGLAPLHYEYDFGDGWQLTIELIDIIDEDQQVPRLIRGERAGPLEDSGGAGGYGGPAPGDRRRVQSRARADARVGAEPGRPLG